MREILQQRIDAWLSDHDSTVTYAEELEGRWAVRVAQDSRDATTVWFRPMERSLEFEAYVLPIAEAGQAILTQALTRNQRSWRVFFALTDEGGLVLRGRMAASEVTMDNLDSVLGEVVETVDIAFRPLLRSLHSDREKSV